MSEEKDQTTPEWEYKTRFRIVDELRTVTQKAKEASEKELKALRRKLDKLTYGS